MAIKLIETFAVQASIDDVWRFLLTPERVVLCMPGAELQEVVDDHTFLGNIKVKVGPIVTTYRGKVQFAEVDEQLRAVRLIAEGRESSGGGAAAGVMSSVLRSLPDGQTEVAIQAEVSLTGRVMQFGRGMIESVSQQLFQQFVNCTRARLESSPAERAKTPMRTEPEPVRPVSLVFSVIWSTIVRVVRRLFRRTKK